MTLNEFRYLTSTSWDEKYQIRTNGMSKGSYTRRHRLRLRCLSVPDAHPF